MHELLSPSPEQTSMLTALRQRMEALVADQEGKTHRDLGAAQFAAFDNIHITLKSGGLWPMAESNEKERDT